MDIIKFIDDQTQRTRVLTETMINEIPEDLWYTIPEGINSNIAWQAGHLIIAQHYHSVSVIAGLNKQIMESIPIMDYVKMYSFDSHAKAKDPQQPSPEILKKQLHFVNEIARNILQELKEEDLNKPLEPTRMKHPVANTKYEALTWNFRHEMWHCGQIAMIRRGLNMPVEFRPNK